MYSGFRFSYYTVLPSKSRCCCIVTLLMLLQLTAGDKNTTESQKFLIQCRMENGQPVCQSGYLVATIFIFLFLIAVIIGQCVILLYQSRMRYLERKETLGTGSDDDGLYSDINQAEFFTSLSGKLERNDSIGSSSLNFLSPGGCPSAKSLSNISSLSDQQDTKARTDPLERQDTIIYSEINSKRHTIVPMSGVKTSVSSCASRDSQRYDFIKSLSLEGGKKARPSTYCEIPFGKNGILRRQTKTQGDTEGSKPLSVKADVHTSPVEGSGNLDSDLALTKEENRRNSSERPATYIDVFADEDDFREYIGSMRKNLDEKQEETSVDNVAINDRLEVGNIQTRDRIATYLSINDNDFGLEDDRTLQQLNFSDGRAQWRDNRNVDYSMLRTNGTFIPQSESDVNVSFQPGMAQLSDTGGLHIDANEGREKVFGESVPMVSLVN